MTVQMELVRERMTRPPRRLGVAMVGGNPGRLARVARERNEYDRYVTPIEATRALLHRYGHHIKGTVWEPCAGPGHMALPIARHPGVQRLLATDRFPVENPLPGIKIGMTNVFDVTAGAKRRFDAIITNPPFDIAEDIIRHVLTVAEPEVPFFAVLLKSTYWHAKSRLPLFRDLAPAIIAPLTFRLDFEGLGRPVMECAWNIWINGNITTMFEPLEEAPANG